MASASLSTSSLILAPCFALSLFFFSLFLIRSWQKTSKVNPISGWASSLSLKRLRRSPARIQTNPVRIQTRSVLLTDEAHHEELNQDGLDLDEQRERNRWCFSKRSGYGVKLLLDFIDFYLLFQNFIYRKIDIIYLKFLIQGILWCKKRIRQSICSDN